MADAPPSQQPLQPLMRGLGDGAFVDNMEIDVDDSLAMDHEVPTEKTDENFFNSAPPRHHTPCAPPQKTLAHPTRSFGRPPPTRLTPRVPCAGVMAGVR